MVVLALGSNIGNRLENLRMAARLIPLDGKEFSPVYESEALLPIGAPCEWNIPYLNAVVLGSTTMSPISLLQRVKQIEHSLGRCDNKFWGPRTIDIDILLWDHITLESERLIIPHRYMHKRDFVLVPICDICPQFPHPILEITTEALLLLQGNIEIVKKYPSSSLSRIW